VFCVQRTSDQHALQHRGVLSDCIASSKAERLRRSKLREIAAERLICGGSGSEPDPKRSSRCPAHPRRVPVEGGWAGQRAQKYSAPERLQSITLFRRRLRGRTHGPTIITCFHFSREDRGPQVQGRLHVMGIGRDGPVRACSELKDAFVPAQKMWCYSAKSPRSGRSPALRRRHSHIGDGPLHRNRRCRAQLTSSFMRVRPRFRSNIR